VVKNIKIKGRIKRAANKTHGVEISEG